MEAKDQNKEGLFKISPELLKQEAVLLSRGKNLLGQAIYAYIKIPMTNYYSLQEAMKKGESFKPSDYGQVLVAGIGNPSDELKEEMRVKYGLVDTPRPEKSDTEEKKEIPIPDFSAEEPMEGLDKDLSMEIKKLGHKISQFKK